MWKLVFGLLVYLQARVLSTEALCTETVYVGSRYTELLHFSPGYPENFTGSNCNFKFVAPRDFRIFAQCSVELSSNSSSNCSSVLYLSRDGDLSLGDAEKICQTAELNRTSVFRSMTIGFNASAPARFLCKLTMKQEPCRCGWSQKTAITNGTNANITTGSFPSLVAIYNFDLQRIVCGGTIISHWLVVTARHCLSWSRNLAIIAGYTGLFEGNTELIKVWDEYVPSDGSDLAVLRTMKYMEWSETVGPACLPFVQESDTFTLEGVKANLVGWGVAGTNANSPRVVKHMLANITSEKDCNDAYPDTFISPYQFCTHAVGNSTDRFDTGGPVLGGLKTMFLLGVVLSEPSTNNALGINVNILPFVKVLDDFSQTGLCRAPFNRTILGV